LTLPALSIAAREPQTATPPPRHLEMRRTYAVSSDTDRSTYGHEGLIGVRCETFLWLLPKSSWT